MKALSGKELIRILEARGWNLRNVKGSHHIYTKKGSIVRLSIPVHGNRSLRRGLLQKLLKDAGLDPREV